MFDLVLVTPKNSRVTYTFSKVQRDFEFSDPNVVRLVFQDVQSNHSGHPFILEGNLQSGTLILDDVQYTLYDGSQMAQTSSSQWQRV